MTYNKLERKLAMREKIFSILEELGILIEEEEKGSDFDLMEYFLDSIQFISFIVEVEKCLGRELPDEYLLPERYGSFNALCDAWEHIALGINEVEK